VNSSHGHLIGTFFIEISLNWTSQIFVACFALLDSNCLNINYDKEKTFFKERKV
jgi:hypothetical protein